MFTISNRKSSREKVVEKSREKAVERSSRGTGRNAQTTSYSRVSISFSRTRYNGTRVFDESVS